MRRIIIYLLLSVIASCNSGPTRPAGNTISVSIPPIAYFVKSIGAEKYDVNVLVPPGADPHIYEPVPGQITALRNSIAYISNGHLSFEMNWLGKFYETNPSMKKLDLSSDMDLIGVTDEHEGHGHGEGADPHFWISPKRAATFARDIFNFMCGLSPADTSDFRKNYSVLSGEIEYADSLATSRLAPYKGKTFMIFHPALGYIALDYGLIQLAVETEGKEPSASDMRHLIDEAREQNIKVILVQKGFDTKNANAIASETGAVVRVIDPLAEDWKSAVTEIINILADSFEKQ
ncbi:MAG: zinc ABC transporter substrate-binding protein [Bacteroidales bacterium]